MKEWKSVFCPFHLIIRLHVYWDLILQWDEMKDGSALRHKLASGTWTCAH